MRKLLAAILVVAMATPVAAQWFTLPTPGIPRLPDGKPNLAAPAPRTQDGKPDLSGIWRANPKFNNNLAADLNPGDVPLTPPSAAILEQRRDTLGKDAGSLPSPRRAATGGSSLSVSDPSAPRPGRDPL